LELKRLRLDLTWIQKNWIKKRKEPVSPKLQWPAAVGWRPTSKLEDG
jgi:hypothetical protein